MKFTPQQRRRHSVRRVPALVWAAGIATVALGVLVVVRPPLPHAVRAAGQMVAAPLWRGQSGMEAAVFGAVASLTSKRALYDENIALHEELSAMRRENFKVQLLQAENSRLKLLFGREKQGQSLVAAILRSQDASVYDTLIIDAGAAEGVQENDLVVAEGDVALGSVRTVYDHTSLVVLFSAPGAKTPVLIGATSTVAATAEGQGGGTFLVTLPRGAGIAQGDMVSLSTMATYLFAVVEKIEADSADSFVRVYFRTPVNVSSLRFIKVERGVRWTTSML